MNHECVIRSTKVFSPIKIMRIIKLEFTKLIAPPTITKPERIKVRCMGIILLYGANIIFGKLRTVA